MKLRSLFLASIAALAMASCSNEENEVVDNAGKTETALMQFGITFPQSVASRAIGDTEGGLDTEQTFKNVTLVLASNTTVEVKSLLRSDFNPATADGTLSTTGKYYQTAAIPVTAASEVSVYAILNANGDLVAKLNALVGKTLSEAQTTIAELKATAAYGSSSLDGLTGDNCAAKNGEFLMFGNGITNLAANATTSVAVMVNRVAAKLKEETRQLAFDVATTTSTLDKAAAVTLTNYTFTNLNTESLLKPNATAIASFLDAQKFPATVEVYNAYTYKGMSVTAGLAAADQITYCFENTNTAETLSGEKLVSVIYKANVKIDNITEGTTFYVYNSKIYTYSELAAIFSEFASTGLNENSSIAEYAKYTIKKYEKGVCYYRAEIKTGNDPKILRNNVYKLNVLNITKLGFPTPDAVADVTAMLLNITVAQWTVNQNDIEL